MVEAHLVPARVSRRRRSLPPRRYWSPRHRTVRQETSSTILSHPRPPTPDFSYRVPPRATIKRIPAGARQRASSLFERRLRRVIAFPDKHDSWRDLLQFGGCLAQPIRGGARRNFTALVIGQIDREENGVAPQPTSSQGRNPWSARGSGSSANTPNDINRATARRASVKLDAGDIRGAVRLLCSDDSIAPHDTLTLHLLKGKHPLRPADRRPAPTLFSAPLSVSAEDVRRAIRGFSPGSAGELDGLRQQHLSDMTDSHVSSTLVESLAKFLNVVLVAGVPE